MKPISFLAIVATIALSACSRDTLPSSVRTVSVAPAAKRAPMVLAPTQEEYFSQMATEHNPWVVNALRSALLREIGNGGRFQSMPAGTGDAEITLEKVRHGLIEVSADNYAVQIGGSASVWQGGKQIATRDFNGTSGTIRPLKDFEDSAVYESALQGVADKVALEMVTTL